MDTDNFIFFRLKSPLRERAEQWSAERREAAAANDAFAREIAGKGARASYDGGEGLPTGICASVDWACDYMRLARQLRPSEEHRYWKPRLNCRRGRELDRRLRLCALVPSHELFVATYFPGFDAFGFTARHYCRCQLVKLAGTWVLILPRISKNENAKPPRGAVVIFGSLFLRLREMHERLKGDA